MKQSYFLAFFCFEIAHQAHSIDLSQEIRVMTYSVSVCQKMIEQSDWLVAGLMRVTHSQFSQ